MPLCCRQKGCAQAHRPAVPPLNCHCTDARCAPPEFGLRLLAAPRVVPNSPALRALERWSAVGLQRSLRQRCPFADTHCHWGCLKTVGARSKLGRGTWLVRGQQTQCQVLAPRARGDSTVPERALHCNLKAAAPEARLHGGVPPEGSCRSGSRASCCFCQGSGRATPLS